MELPFSRCRVCGVAAHATKVSKSSGHTRQIGWLRRMQRATHLSYPAQLSWPGTTTTNISKKNVPAPSVSPSVLAGIPPTVLNEYAQSVADVGLTSAMILNSKILDFGCADGNFPRLVSAWARIQPSSRNRYFRRDGRTGAGKGHRATTLEAQGEFESEKFDLVTLWTFWSIC